MDGLAAVWNKHRLTPDAVAAAAEGVLVDVVREDKPVDAVRLLRTIAELNTGYAQEMWLDALERLSIVVVRPQPMSLNLRAAAEKREASLLDPVGLPELPRCDLGRNWARIARPGTPRSHPGDKQREYRDAHERSPLHGGSVHPPEGGQGRSSLDRDITRLGRSSACECTRTAACECAQLGAVPAALIPVGASVSHPKERLDGHA